ncbi:MAG: MBL fold metallo-hydrolase [Deltaproteobacteria bacterium]|nr:MBL fold metallo-hydrolase [Deltaproteobacteria bacterium]
MRLTVLGSADAFNSAGRGHSCYLLEGPGWGPLAVDFGATALGALYRLVRDPSEIVAVALTHLHGDHIGGLPYLYLDGMFNTARAGALRVIGPRGTRARLDALYRATYGDVAAARSMPYELRVDEIEPGGEAVVGGVTVRAFAADHMPPPDQALCLRITTPEGKTVAFSGDTAFCDGLFAAAAGADLLLAECSYPKPPCGQHCTWVEWVEALPRIGTRRLVFTHLGQQVRQFWRELVREAPAGYDLSFADDGMVLVV